MLSTGDSKLPAWRRAGAALAALAVVALVANPAAAEDTGGATAPADTTIPNLGPATPGTVLCTVSNKNLDNVTGLAMAPSGTLYAVEGAGESSAVELWSVNPTTCEVSRKTYGLQPRNPQDLAVGPDGSLWVLDVVDTRPWMTFEHVADPTSNASAVANRANRPDPNTAINGTALLMQPDGAPVVFAATAGKAVLYRPNGPLVPDVQTNLPVLTQVGEFTPANTGTGSAFDVRLVTGAAIAPDRSRLVVRTRSDAYEFTIGADGDIVAAITKGTPVITPLPGEEDGQSITYSADGTKFLTLSGGENPTLRSYTPYVPPPPTPAAHGGSGGGGLDFGDITNIAIGTGLLGVAAIAAGVIGIVRFRRRAELDDEDDYDGYDQPRPPRPRGGGGRRPRPEVPRRSPVRVGEGRGPDGGYAGRAPGGYDQGYGGGQSYGPGAGGGQVYGGGGGGGQSGGGQVYGGAGGSGQVYGPGGQVYGGDGGQPGGGRVYGGGGPQQGGGVYGRPRHPDDAT